MARPVLLLKLLSDLLQAPDIPLQRSRVAPGDRPTHAILWVQQHILKVLCILRYKPQRQVQLITQIRESSTRLEMRCQKEKTSSVGPTSLIACGRASASGCKEGIDCNTLGRA